MAQAMRTLLALAASATLMVTATQGQHLRSLKRLKPKDAPEICTYIYNQDILPVFSNCLNEQEVKGQSDYDCSATEMQSYEACSARPECTWWHLLGQDLCMANPCYRINNGLCTIQNTGGRCVWYTREQNLALRGINAPGCYKSPCSNPLDNTPKGCAAKTNDFYGCVWCPKYKGQAYGCMNDKKTSTAQCWNINGKGSSSGCNACNQKENGSCKSKKCQDNCCQSPLCTCDISNERSGEEVAVNILSG